MSGSRLPLCFLVGLVAGIAEADAIDDYVRAEAQKRGIPGMAIAIVRNGKISKAQGYGYANLELRVPARPETVFQTGSVGKPFTATAIMLLVEQGRLALDDSIAPLLPGAPGSWKAITVRHLLSHTSGIPNYTSGKVDYRRDYSEGDLVRLAATFPLEFEPGSSWSYSNTGYVLLGAIIRSVTGKFYGDFLSERVFQPLEMRATRVISESDIVPNRASGYRMVRGQVKNQDWVSPSLNTTADGSLHTTVLDLAKWDIALAKGGVVKPNTLERMWAPIQTKRRAGDPNQGERYGLGWAISQQNGRRRIEHGGAWQGFSAHIAKYPDDKLTVIVMCNLAGAAPGSMAHAIAGLAVPALKAKTPKTRPDPDPSVGSLLKSVLAELAAGKPKASRFSAELGSLLAKNAAATARELTEMGALKSLEFLSAKPCLGGREFVYLARFEVGTLRLTATLDSNRVIVGLLMAPE